MVEASVTGLFRTILIILGIFVLLRFIGQLMIAKRNMEEERRLNERQRKAQKERDSKLRDFGKTRIVKGKVDSNRGRGVSDFQDVDFEEVP